MSREIKFRIWDTKHNKWVSDIVEEIVDLYNNNDSEYQNDSLYEYNESWEPRIASLGEYEDFDGRLVWEQYTGLKDKNGKEIYEGDIVRSTTGIIYDVVFDVESACFRGKNITIYNLKAERFWESEIVGNIHEDK